MDKDRAIITQVAAKIAADLTTREGDTGAKLAEFAIMFPEITGMLLDSIYDTNNSTQTPLADVVSLVTNAFNGTEVPSAPSTGGGVTIVGKQHGDVPDWLIKACKRDGITRVYDNRDGLAVNPKRPLFKAVDEDKAYWAPRAR